MKIPRRTMASDTCSHVSVRSLSLTLIAIMIAALVGHFIVYFNFALNAIRYPFELFEPEGIVWQQAMLIPGDRMYGDINQFPFIVFHYPPLYHLVVRAAAALGFDPLASGRSISWLASLAAGAMIASLAFRLSRYEAGRLASLAGAVTAGLTFFCFYPVVAMSPLMRVDMLAIALSYLGVWCATRSSSSDWLPYIAMVLFVLAAFTKQTCVLAPLATVSVMVLVNPRRTLKVLCFGLLLGGAGLASLNWITHGGFLRHLVLYNINRFSLRLAMQEILGQAPQSIFVMLALAFVITKWKQLALERGWKNLASFRGDVASSEALQAVTIVTLYFGLSTCSLIALGKSGGGLNYFIEWMGILSILIGPLVAAVATWQLHKPERGANRIATIVGLMLPILILLQIRPLPASWDFGSDNFTEMHELDSLVARIRGASQPVLSEDMVLLMKAGKEVPWEPAIFTELASTGRWDERLILDMISARAFAFIITRGPAEQWMSDGRLTPGVEQAIRTAYPRTEEQGGRTLHLPPT
jgi:hypothetical protein